jgi:hypothetical protein
MHLGGILDFFGLACQWFSKTMYTTLACQELSIFVAGLDLEHDPVSHFIIEKEILQATLPKSNIKRFSQSTAIHVYQATLVTFDNELLIKSVTLC